MNSLDEIIGARYAVISVMGPYAEESEKEIFRRKTREISDCGFTFWHHQSLGAKPEMVQKLGSKAKREGEPVYLILIKPASQRSVEGPRKSPQATVYKKGVLEAYSPIPKGIYVETGTRPYALIIKNLNLAHGAIDLWDYSDFFKRRAVKTRQGASTICAVKIPSYQLKDKMKSHVRNIVAYAEVIEPFSVWLK